MRRCVGLALLLAAAFAAPFAWPQAGAGVVRYHYGDNPDWADPSFDDSAWPIAPNSSFPAPAYQSDGFFWVRAQVAIPAGTSGPVAIESQTIDPFPNVQELWVNGRLVGRNGDFPAHARPLAHPRMLVFGIPPGVVRPGSVALVVLRAWDAPADNNMSLVLRHPDPVSVEFSIAGSPLLHALAANAQDRAWLRFWPQSSLALVFVMLGFAVLALGIWARDRTLLLCALWLVAVPAYLVSLPLRSLLAGSAVTSIANGFFILNALGMCVFVEFLWTVQAFRDRIFRTAAHVCWIGLTISGILAVNAMHPGALVMMEVLATNWLVFAFNLINSGANLVALAGRGRNRPVAAAMLFISIGYFLGIAGHSVDFNWLGIGLFGASFYLSTLLIAILLMRQTWTAWRNAEGLRVEFAAARELQQRLVPASLPAVAGYSLNAIYLPAAEVGGDFYQIIEQGHGSALIVVGDVSGKGLKAAMTGVLAIGALRTLAVKNLSPAELLQRLNVQLCTTQDGGFVTCVCARIDAEGALTLANAGHLAPYRNGEEVPIDNGLPLGIAPDAAYTETALQLTPGDTLTFLSDGVVEAQSPTGELFGFDRTRNISTQSAEQIAHAAQAHGQEDDITVLTLTFAPAEVLHA